MQAVNPADKIVSIELPKRDWFLLISVLSSIIEQTRVMQDPRIKSQTKQFSKIREIIDRATD